MAEIVDSKPNVDATEKTIRTRSKVPFSNKFANTVRFGEYSPFFCMEAVNNDRIPLNSRHSLRSYTLKSPILSDISIKKDFFQVPMESILPFNWDKIYTNPVIGDDIDASKANTILSIKSVAKFINNFFDAAKDFIDAEVPNYDKAATCILRALFISEMFFSNGSLFSCLGIHLQNFFVASKNIDSIIDEWITTLENSNNSITLYFQDSGGEYAIPITFIKDGDRLHSFRYMLEKIRDDYSFEVSGITSEDTFESLFSTVLDYFVVDGGVINYTDDVTKPINYSRLIAYQLVCSHFYSNDHIDFIYSAELYRQNISSILDGLLSSLSTLSGNPSEFPLRFSYNGVSTLYDYVSGAYFSKALFAFSDAGSYYYSLSSLVCNYLRLLFGFNRSLRYQDYFVGSKSRPLAIGDVGADVDTLSHKVSAIDITRNIQVQRFLNFVNRTGRKFEEYVSKLGGHYVAPDWHNPKYLSHTSDMIYTPEVENTGSAQFTEKNSVSSSFQSNASKFLVEVDIDRPSIIIGIMYFDIPRFYATNIERQAFHIDRFDMFNPFLQFIGDQDINIQELDPASIDDVPFAYTMRHQEYKTRVNMVAGAFVDNYLPCWEFIADEDYRYGNDIPHISPDFIRSRSSELDKFYVSLAGYSLGHYFHFIVLNDNICNPSRPMAYAPSIL